MKEKFEATRQHYEEFVTTTVWRDLLSYIQEALELNRDLLEGLSDVESGESVDTLRGRCHSLRDLVRYVAIRSVKEDEELGD